jgi:hypothetical protein
MTKTNRIVIVAIALFVSAEAAGQSFSCEGAMGTTKYDFSTATMTVETENFSGATKRKEFSFKGNRGKIAVINYPEIAEKYAYVPSKTEMNLETGMKKTYSTVEFMNATMCTPSNN